MLIRLNTGQLAQTKFTAEPALSNMKHFIKTFVLISLIVIMQVIVTWITMVLSQSIGRSYLWPQ